MTAKQQIILKSIQQIGWAEVPAADYAEAEALVTSGLIELGPERKVADPISGEEGFWRRATRRE